MTQYVTDLQHARERFVQSRRALAEKISKGQGVVINRNTFVEVQNAIEQIDKAIAEEKILALAGPEDFNKKLKFPENGYA